MDSAKTSSSKNSSSESDKTKEPASRVDALGRKVWDRNYFTEKAIAKSSGGDVVEETISSLYQGTFKKPVVPVPEVREDLKPRTETLDFSKYVGKSETIDSLGPKSKQGGFFCKTCNCLLKDSQTYLDHLNGKKHNRMLGMTMRVQKVDAKTVAAKLRNLASQDSMAAKTKEEMENDARERIKELEMYEKELREKRKLMKKEKKKKKQKLESSEVNEENNGVKRESLVKSEHEHEHQYQDDQHHQEYQEQEDEEEEYLSPELQAMKDSGLPISFG